MPRALASFPTRVIKSWQVLQVIDLATEFPPTIAYMLRGCVQPPMTVPHT